jgi:hypothetical protein
MAGSATRVEWALAEAKRLEELSRAIPVPSAEKSTAMAIQFLADLADPQCCSDHLGSGTPKWGGCIPWSHEHR